MFSQIGGDCLTLASLLTVALSHSSIAKKSVGLLKTKPELGFLLKLETDSWTTTLANKLVWIAINLIKVQT